MKYVPPLAAERSMLRNLTKPFDRAVFRFTDDTAETIKAGGRGGATGSASQAQDALKDTNQELRLRLKDNLHARILHDVLSPAPGGLFHAYISGQKYSGKLAYGRTHWIGRDDLRCRTRRPQRRPLESLPDAARHRGHR